MTRIEGRTEFRRTSAEMFDFLADPRHEPEYNPLIVRPRPATVAWPSRWPDRPAPGAPDLV